MDVQVAKVCLQRDARYGLARRQRGKWLARQSWNPYRQHPKHSSKMWGGHIFKVYVWKAALEKDPPELAPTNFGWEKDEASRSLLPIPICSCTYGCTQSNQVRLCNGPAMRNYQMHVWNCSNVMHHFLWVSWNGRVLQHMDKKVQRYRRRRGQWQWWRRPVWWLNCFEGVIPRVWSTDRQCNSSFSHMP